MFYDVKPLRIGKNWDLTDEQITDKTPAETKLIISYKNKFLSKVNTGEWTEDEYKKFSSGIKKMYIEAFINFIDIFDCFLELTKEEVLDEINNLIEKGLIKNDTDVNIGFLSNAIVEICSRILSISYVCLNEDEKKANLTHKQHVELYSLVLEQLNNQDSDYVNLLISIFEEWTNKYISNEKLKTVILNKKEFIIKNKQIRVRKQLSTNLKIVKENSDIHSQYKTTLVNKYKIQRFRKEK